MVIPLTDYVKIKDNYCIAYLGDNQCVLDELVRRRKKLEELYPGVRIYICGKLQHPDVIPVSELDKSKFAFIREINELKEILQESGFTA